MPDYGTIVTIRNLLNRTSGIRDWHDLTEIQGWGEGVSAYTQDCSVNLIAHQKGLNFQPGSEYSYSNSNFILAAEIVARVSAEGTRDATVTLLPKGDALIVTGENALWWSVKPIYQDTFDGEDYSSWRIAFLRTAEGDIEAMTLPRSRTRALRCERLR
jgi:hypothetical protein